MPSMITVNPTVVYGLVFFFMAVASSAFAITMTWIYWVTKGIMEVSVMRENLKTAKEDTQEIKLDVKAIHARLDKMRLNHASS